MKSVVDPKWRRGPALAAIALALAATGGIAKAAPLPIAPTAPPAGDIRDIRGPIHIPSPWLWAEWLAGGAALAGLVYGGWRWNHRRIRAASPPPYQVALARLEAIRGLMRPENAREFSIAVSEIVRQFIEERFQVRAARRTTEEFLRDLIEPSDILLAEHRKLLEFFLGRCDLAKFARWVLSTGEMTDLLQSARDFVVKAGAAPAPEPGAPAEPPQAAWFQPRPNRPRQPSTG